MSKGGHTSFQPSPKADGASHMEKSLFMISLYCGTCVHCLLQTQAQPAPPSTLCPLGSVSIKSQLCALAILLVLAILTPPSVAVVPQATYVNSASILWRRGDRGARGHRRTHAQQQVTCGELRKTSRIACGDPP
jgi:hypothetical protein